MSLFARALQSAETFLEQVDDNAQRALESLEADAQSDRAAEAAPNSTWIPESPSRSSDTEHERADDGDGTTSSQEDKYGETEEESEPYDDSEQDVNFSDSPRTTHDNEPFRRTLDKPVDEQNTSQRSLGSEHSSDSKPSPNANDPHSTADRATPDPMHQLHGDSHTHDTSTDSIFPSERGQAAELPGGDGVNILLDEEGDETKPVREKSVGVGDDDASEEMRIDNGQLSESGSEYDEEKNDDVSTDDDGSEDGSEDVDEDESQNEVPNNNESDDENSDENDNEKNRQSKIIDDEAEGEGEDSSGEDNAKECSELECANDDVRDQLEEEEEELHALSTEVDGLNRNLQEAKEILQEVEEELRNRIEEVEEMTVALSEAKTRADKAEAEVIRETSASEEIVERATKQLGSAQRETERQLAELLSKVEFLEAEKIRIEESLFKEGDRVFESAEDAKREAQDALRLLQLERLSHSDTKSVSQRRTDDLELNVQLAVDALLQAEARIAAERKTATDGKERRARATAEFDAVGMEESLLQSRVIELGSIVNKLRTEMADDEEMRDLAAYNLKVGDLNKELAEKETKYRSLFEATSEERKMLEDMSLKSPEAAESIRALSEVETQLLRVADENLTRQAELEASRSENRALQHQLETERSRMRHAQNHVPPPAARSARGVRTAGHGGEESWPPGRLLQLQHRGTYPGALRQLLGTIDRVGLHGVNWLRRKPEIRVVAVIYVLLLHAIWYVLLHWRGVQTSQLAVLQPE